MNKYVMFRISPDVIHFRDVHVQPDRAFLTGLLLGCHNMGNYEMTKALRILEEADCDPFKIMDETAVPSVLRKLAHPEILQRYQFKPIGRFFDEMAEQAMQQIRAGTLECPTGLSVLSQGD
jgi:hypothetical protein